MAKVYCIIGFDLGTEESADQPGVYKRNIVERGYTGDLIQSVRRQEANQDTIIDDIHISNRLSIVHDIFASNHLNSIIYVEFMGAKWTVNSIDISYPRLILSFGREYHGNED